MRKIVILAISAIFVANISAQEMKKGQCEGKKISKEERVEFKKLAELQTKYYDKFRKDLSARQVEKVMQLEEPCGPKPCCGKHGHQHPEGPKPAPKAE